MSTRQTGRPLVLDVLVVSGAFAVAGVLAGLLWDAMVQPPLVTRVAGGTSMGEVQLGREFAIDGWYTLIGAAAGLLLAFGLLRWGARDPVVTLVLVLAGSALAAWLAARTGLAVGPDDPTPALQEAPEGARFPLRLEVSAWACYLSWPLGAALGAVVALWGPRGRASTSTPS